MEASTSNTHHVNQNRPRGDTMSSIASTFTQSDLWTSPGCSPATPASSIFPSSPKSHNRTRSVSNASLHFVSHDNIAVLSDESTDNLAEATDASLATSPADLSAPGTPFSNTSRNASSFFFQASSSRPQTPSSQKRSFLSLTKPFKSRRRASSVAHQEPISNSPLPSPQSRSRASSLLSLSNRNSRDSSIKSAKIFQRILFPSKSYVSPSDDHSNGHGSGRKSENMQNILENRPNPMTFRSELLVERPPLISRYASAPLAPVLSARLETIYTDRQSAVVRPANLFEHMLPRELQIRVFSCLFEAIAASEDLDERWSGYAGAVKQLLVLCLVSKSWMSLALDGQLWGTIDTQRIGSDLLKTEGLRRVLRQTGPFIRSLRLKGMISTNDYTLFDLIESCELRFPDFPQTNLSTLDLTGCRKLSSRSLIALFQVSPLLQSVSVPGLTAMTSSALAALFRTAFSLKTLNISRCSRLVGSNITTDTHPRLSSLFISGLDGVDCFALQRIALSFPLLTKLDLSYCRSITDTAIRWLVRTQESPDSCRVTALTYLNLSHCSRLSDNGLLDLACALPVIEYLDLSHIGIRLRDTGLIALLKTTPRLKKLDLEGNPELTDELLRGLRKCTFLKHISLSYAVHISDAGFVRLIRDLPHLQYLEIDNTRITNIVTQEFTRQMRARGVKGAEIVAIDCRGLTRTNSNELADLRTRRARKGWQWQAQHYSQATGLNEFDENKVIVKNFSSWAVLDQHDHIDSENSAHNEPFQYSRSALRRAPFSQERESPCLIS